MFDPSSFANPTPLAHADASGDVLSRGGTSQSYFKSSFLKLRNKLLLYKSLRLKCAGHLARMNEYRCWKKIFLAKPAGNRPLG
ncbi:UNVERIFIED_CONTAM: hypothetical protein NCL1_24747 [Trichonephila clavipes]